MAWRETSEEVVLSEHCGKIVLGLALYRGGQTLEFLKAYWVVYTFLKKIELGLAHSYQTIKSEKAFTSVVEGVKTNRLKS